MKKKLLALFMGSALLLSACGGGGNDTAEQPTEPTEPAEGTEEQAPAVDVAAAEGLYAQSCASCHGQNLEGVVGPELAAIGNKLDAAGIENVIVNGQGAMPPGLLKGDDAKAVAEWLAAKQ